MYSCVVLPELGKINLCFLITWQANVCAGGSNAQSIVSRLALIRI